MTYYIDVTESFDFGWPDDEYIPINKCACGHKFGSWEFLLSVYKDDPKACPKCGTKYYFEQTIRIIEVREVVED